MNTLETLKAEKAKLVEILRADFTQRDDVFLKIKDIDAQITQAERVKLIENVNAKQKRLRDIAAQVWECEQSDKDITNSDGSFHAVKVKKYPKLAALQYASATYKDGLITEMRVNGERFQMFNTKHEHGQPTQYTRPESFIAFLELNSIMTEDMTIEIFNAIAAKCAEINAEFKEAVKKFDNQKDSLNMSALSYWGLFGQQNAGHIYEYTPNK
jgi:hypothetical protein